MNIEEIIKSLNDIKTFFKEIILTNNYEKVSDEIISWNNYKSGIFKNLYSKEYEYIVKNRQYSFLLKDDMGCIQYYYEFKNNIISKIKMAYYPYPVKLNESSDNIEDYFSETNDRTLLEYYYDIWEIFNHQFELNIDDMNLKKVFEKSQKLGNNESIENLLLAKFDLKYEHTNSSHIRIDYDAKVKTHNKCEIQIGAVNQIRLPIDKILSPIVFFDFIIKNIFRNKPYYEGIKSKSSYISLFEYHRNQKSNIEEFNEDNIYII